MNVRAPFQALIFATDPKAGIQAHPFYHQAVASLAGYPSSNGIEHHKHAA